MGLLRFMAWWLFVGTIIVWPLYLLLTGRGGEEDERADVDARPRYARMAHRTSAALGQAATMTMHWCAAAGTWAVKWWIE